MTEEFNDFMEELLYGLQMSKANSEYEFQFLEVVKRNDSKKVSLCIRQKGESIGVNLYLDDLVGRYQKADCNMDCLIQSILKQLQGNILSNRFTDATVAQMVEMRDFEKMRGKVLFKIINKDMNTEYLKNSVYVPVLDFAVCFFVLVGTEEETGTMLVTKSVIDSWRVSVSELYQLAMENTPRLMPYLFRNIIEVLECTMPDDGFSQYIDSQGIDRENFSLYVLENTKRTFGAGAMLYEGLLKQIATKIGADEVIVLPSSVHECILLPMVDEMDVAQLKNLVRLVNNTSVSPEDRLSENVYLYSKETDKITIMTE